MSDIGFGVPSPPTAAADRQPPTASDRLRMFISLAAEHGDLVAALKTGTTAIMRAPETAEERIDHTRRQLRAASARKFIFDKNDNTHLSKVLDSADACVTSTAPRIRDFIQGLREELERVRTHSLVEYVLGDDEPVDDLDIVTDVVYGRLLHGDYAKWWRTEERKGTGWEVASVMNWLSDAEVLIAACRDMVINGVKGGYLDLR